MRTYGWATCRSTSTSGSGYRVHAWPKQSMIRSSIGHKTAMPNPVAVLVPDPLYDAEHHHFSVLVLPTQTSGWSISTGARETRQACAWRSQSRRPAIRQAYIVLSARHPTLMNMRALSKPSHRPPPHHRCPTFLDPLSVVRSLDPPPSVRLLSTESIAYLTPLSPLFCLHYADA